VREKSVVFGDPIERLKELTAIPTRMKMISQQHMEKSYLVCSEANQLARLYADVTLAPCLKKAVVTFPQVACFDPIVPLRHSATRKEF